MIILGDVVCGAQRCFYYLAYTCSYKCSGQKNIVFMYDLHWKPFHANPPWFAVLNLVTQLKLNSLL